MSGDPALTRWAAACATHALDEFAQPDADGAARDAIAAARAWSTGEGTAEESRSAAFEAQLLARATTDAGHHALAAAIRAAGTSAASVDDDRLAAKAADYAAEAIKLSSAACELASRIGAERKWQWDRLDDSRRSAILGEEPPTPPAPACAIDTAQH